MNDGFEVLRRDHDVAKILVVEDSADNAYLISILLRTPGYILEFAKNGREAVLQFSKFQPDLVLMDLQMPEMDGFLATRWIRLLEHHYGFKTSIIAVTAFSRPNEIQKCLDAGCDGYILKPFQKAELLGTLAAYLGGIEKKGIPAS